MEMTAVPRFYTASLDQSVEKRREREQRAEAELLAEIFGHPVELLHEESGRPYIPGYDGFISISHSRKTLLIALSPEPLGVDIEQVQDRVLRVREKFLSPDEITALGDDVRAVTRAWCAFEAVFKLTGDLHAKPADFCLTTILDTSDEVAVLATLPR